MRQRSRRAGFTLIEVLVATVILAVGASALLSNLSTSTNNLIRATDSDKLTFYAKRKMDELIALRQVPPGVWFEGTFEEDANKKATAGWRARVIPMRGVSLSYSLRLDRLEMEAWVATGVDKRKTLTLVTYRQTAGN